MRVTRTILVGAVIMLATSASLAHAGASIGPTVGIAKSPDTDSKVMFGAALRLKFLPALAVEGSINYREEEFAGEALTVKSWPVQVTGLFYPLPIAYAAVGVGWYNATFDFKESTLLDDDTKQEFGWHFGGGVELPLGGALRLVADLRYVFLNYDFHSVPGTSEVDDDFYFATTGLLFNL